MRKFTGSIIALAFFLSTLPLPAQIGSARPRKKSPRAVAVMDLDKSGHARLLPVSLFMDGKFYDAGLYMSKPSPIALDSETVYEVIKSGVPQGLFTVEQSRRLDKTWWGEGKWKPYATPSDSEAKKDGPTADDKAKPQVKDDGDDDRPVLKRPKPGDAPQTESKPVGDSPMPVASEPPPDDPDRPTLHRGRPAPTAEKDEPIKFVTKLAGTENFSAAVSDADPTTVRPYTYVWADDDREALTRQMKELAVAELRKAAQRQSLTLPAQAKAADGQPKAKPFNARQTASRQAKAPSLPDPLIAALTDVKLYAYDLDYNNSPQVVLTARYLPKQDGLREADFNLINTRQGIHVTVVGRVNFEGQLQQMFAAVSDPRHLETSPEYEFIDAVDVDGDSRAELLFQRINGESRSFVIYRVVGASMSELFETTPR
jgi:hypothetical protein